MKKSLLALAAVTAITALPTVSRADDAPSLSYNIGAVSDYRYRGISQSRLKPALQGGIDYSNPNGFYVGTWASTIKWIKDTGTIAGVDAGSANLEWDLYGGYKGEIKKDLTYDVGILSYVYPGNKLKDITGANANTTEIYGALTFGPATLKYSHALTNLFGASNDSKGSGYLDLSANFDLGDGWSLTPHVGRQEVHHLSVASYNDYALTVGKDLGKGFSVSAAIIGTDADKNFYVTPAGKFTGKSSLVVGAKYSF